MTSPIALTNFALILWSGLLIVTGSILVLSSQVRKVADILEQRARQGVAGRSSHGGGMTTRGGLGAQRPVITRAERAAPAMAVAAQEQGSSLTG